MQRTHDRGDSLAATPTIEEGRLAQENQDLLLEGYRRGHLDYIKIARRLEGYYLGAGGQYSEEDRSQLDADGRLLVECNLIQPAVDTAAAHQIHNRMDMVFYPAGGEADDETAKILTKVAKHIANKNYLHNKETQVYYDGQIQRRGFFDTRVVFDDNMQGEMEITVHDPLDVVLDPDAKEYNPDTWKRVLITRWMTLDEIEELWGEEKRRRVESCGDGSETTHQALLWQERNNFGGASNNIGSTLGGKAAALTNRIPVIERQESRLEMVRKLVTPSGDVTIIHKDMSPETIAQRQAEGCSIISGVARRIRWIVTARNIVLHNETSPYPWFTVLPYFPRFRRGETRGMVDAGMSPQDIVNKTTMQIVEILGQTSNSGWKVAKGSLTNMTTRDLASNGSQNGLVLEYDPDAGPAPEKITPNTIPSGLDRLAALGREYIRTATGVTEAMQGQDYEEVSGVALQARQFAGLNNLAITTDNLAHTRRLMAERILWVIQNYYTEPRIIQISEEDEYGREMRVPVGINQYDEAAQRIVNDVTLGKYEVVVSERPSQVTFAQTQLKQALEIRNAGVSIPDSVIIRNSDLADKAEILEQMSNAKPEADPLTDAEVRLKNAQARKTDAEATSKSVEAQYSAVQAAQTVATVPQVAGIADEVLKSAGFVDANAAPIIPDPGQPIVAPGAGPISGGGQDGDPMTPDNPDVGLNAGIETARNDGVQQ